MFEAFRVHIKGRCPLIMHNGQLADPLNDYAKAIKRLTSKRKKTDDDYEAISYCEWEGGLYVDESGKPCVPGENIERAFYDASKTQKLGQKAKIAILSDGNWPVIYDGPKDVEALKKDKRFRDTRGVRNPGSGARIMRTRPIFRIWELRFDLSFDTEHFNKDQIVDILGVMGRTIGLLDYRPKFGRFQVVSVNPRK